MTGYDKSPDYAPQGGRSTALAWLVGIVAVAVVIALYVAR